MLSCNGTLKKSYDPNTFESDLEQIREDGKVNDEDLQMLTKYIVLSNIQGLDLKGKSYDVLLEKISDARKLLSDKSTRKDQDQLLKKQKLNPLLNIQLIDKKFMKINNEDVMQYVISFKNITNHRIRTVIGDLSIRDLMDKEIKDVDILLNDGLPGMSGVTKTYQVRYDPLNESDKRIRSKDISELRIEWNPSQIIYQDGTLVL